MTIEDPTKFCAALWDWGILADCFGMSRIKPTDVDGLVEHKGKFLILETKGRGVEVKIGQRILLERLACRGDFTVCIVWGEPGRPEYMDVWNKDGKFTFPKASLDLLRGIVGEWYRGAERNTLPLSLTAYLKRRQENG